MRTDIREFFYDLQYRWPFMFRLKGTVILRIWWQILFVLVYTVIVVTLHTFVPYMRMNFPSTLINVLGVVIGLLLVFRTNTAYDRYWEGRRLWSTMTQNIRSLTRCIWVGVKETGTSKEVVEKLSVINLLIAFAYATKNYLREEYSYDSDGIRDLITHIPKFCTPSSNQSLELQRQFQETLNAQAQAENQNEECPATVTVTSVTINVGDGSTTTRRTGDDGAGDNEGVRSGVILAPGKLTTTTSSLKKEGQREKYRRKSSIHNAFSRSDAKRRSSRQLIFTAHDCVTPTNIPIELSYYISSYIGTVSTKGRDLTDPSTILIMNHALNNLVDCLTGFERILRTPIPLAYSVHLHHSIWLYLLALPYQLVKENSWWTVAIVVLSSFALLGILGIGWEIENPFGYDDNDLPLDDFCRVIHKEIKMIIGHKIPPPDSWILSTSNHPFAPQSMENAVELSTKPVEEIRAKLAKGAQRRVTSKVKETRQYEVRA